MNLLKSALLCCLLSLSLAGMGSHNVSARIEYQLEANSMVRIRVITLSDPSAALVDRCTIDLEVWNSDGTVKINDILDIPRINGPLTDPNFPVSCPGNVPMGEYITPTIKRNVYETVYNYPGPGIYQIHYSDVSRIGNLNNILNSGSISMQVKATVNTSNFIFPNSSPQILNDSVLSACVGQPWLNQLDITDLDGDSLSFALIPCLQSNPPGTIPGYASPGSFGGNFSANPLGNITWLNTANNIGGYAYALRITEWRNGIYLGDYSYDAVVFALTSNCVVGIPEPQTDALTAFPNPASEVIFLSQAADLLQLFDLQGKLLREAIHTDRLSTEGLPEGIHVLRGTNGNSARNFKVNIFR